MASGARDSANISCLAVAVNDSHNHPADLTVSLTGVGQTASSFTYGDG